MNRYVTALLLLVWGAAASPLGAQAARVRVVDAGTGRAIDAAEVRPLGADSLLVRAMGYRAARVGRDASSVALTPLALALDQVVVTAARREQKLADVVTTTEVVNAEAIARTGASDLGSALSATTGVELSGGMPAGTGVMLQGLGSERVLILLDGNPLPGRIAGEFDVSRIPTASIDRIEIVKGAQSTLYGSEAMGGVVNVITKRAERGRPFASAQAVAGSRNRLDGTLAAGGTVGPVAARVEGGRRSIETAPGRADENGAQSTRVDGSARVEWRATERTTVEASALLLDERQRWLSSALYNFGDNVQVTSRLSAEHTRGGTRVRASAFGSSYDHLSRASTQPQPIRGDTGQRQVQRLFQGELSLTQPVGRHLLDAGVQLRQDDTRSVRIPGGRRVLQTVEPSAQLEASLTRRVSLTAGARVSHSTRWGTHATPRVAARVRLTDALTLRAAAGGGFRAPDFRELYMRFTNQSVGYAVHGNEDLRPETSRSLNAGLEWVAPAGYVRAQLFHNRFRGFIETRIISAPGEPPLYQYANVDDGYTRGGEVEGAIALRALRVDAGYSLLDTRDDATGLPLLGRPAHSARATAAHPLAWGARASVSAHYTGRTPMQRDSLGTSYREAYPRLDVRLARPVTRDAELTFHVENALDRRPASWAGYTGRQFTLGVAWARGF